MMFPLGLWGACCHFAQFAKLKCQCQHLRLLQFPSIHTHNIKYLSSRGRHECLSYHLRSSCCLLCLLFPHFLHNIMYYSYNNADQKRLCFSPSVLWMCWPHLRNSCVSWAFSWLIFILTVYATLCVVFCCATALNSALLNAWGLFFLFFLVFWILSHAKVLSFVISLIPLGNFFWSVNFSLLYWF